MGKRSQLISDLVHNINDALMSFIMLLMKFAPIGIFCLVTARFGKAQADGQFHPFAADLGLLHGHRIAGPHFSCVRNTCR